MIQYSLGGVWIEFSGGERRCPDPDRGPRTRRLRPGRRPSGSLWQLSSLRLVDCVFSEPHFIIDRRAEIRHALCSRFSPALLRSKDQTLLTGRMSDKSIQWRNRVVTKPMTNPENEDAYMFLNDVEVATVEAMAECIFPADVSGPGAREATVVVYIDRTLAGFGSSLQNLYRRGLAELDRFTTTHRGGKAFAKLSSAEQNQVLQELEAWGNPALTEASRIAPSLEASSAEPGSRNAAGRPRG